MIVRVLGEGQFRIDDAVFARANVIDDTLQDAVDRNDGDAFAAALGDLVDLITTNGTAVPAQELVGSDAVVPGPGTTIDEVRSLLSEEGLIPD
ncbi:MAG: hypothetical protein U0Y82_14770 [Thermoleophilia bacterium]